MKTPRRTIYYVGSLNDTFTFLSLKEAREFGRKNNRLVFTVKQIQYSLPVGANQRNLNKIYELEQEIKHIKKQMRERKSEDRNFPYEKNFKDEQWSARKYKAGI